MLNWNGVSPTALAVALTLTLISGGVTQLRADGRKGSSKTSTTAAAKGGGSTAAENEAETENENEVENENEAGGGQKGRGNTGGGGTGGRRKRRRNRERNSAGKVAAQIKNYVKLPQFFHHLLQHFPARPHHRLR